MLHYELDESPASPRQEGPGRFTSPVAIRTACHPKAYLHFSTASVAEGLLDRFTGLKRDSEQQKVPRPEKAVQFERGKKSLSIIIELEGHMDAPAF